MKRADLTDEYVKETCKIGQRHNCCRYLTMAPSGWSCVKNTSLKAYLDQRVLMDTIIAQGDNCEGIDDET